MVTSAVARHLHKLTAYKDEYEVARLFLAPEFRGAVEGEFGTKLDPFGNEEIKLRNVDKYRVSLGELSAEIDRKAAEPTLR